jgi:hypothetical protein
MAEEPLYNKNGVKIEINPNSSQDHFLYLGKDAETAVIYPMGRGILAELARGTSLEIITGLSNLYYDFDLVVKSGGLHPMDISTAIREAHSEEERRYQQFVLEESCDGCCGGGG